MSYSNFFTKTNVSSSLNQQLNDFIIRAQTESTAKYIWGGGLGNTQPPKLYFVNNHKYIWGKIEPSYTLRRLNNCCQLIVELKMEHTNPTAL